ncbi:799_t:CDS:2, partial [Acaulospora colombiana]
MPNMPNYFQFLTLMAFHVFMKEKVDVAIVEVGIGGEYDSTNIIEKPMVCGVTSLGLDHQSILGDTIDKISWHKGGIFKENTPAFTVDQPESALDVLKNRAEIVNAPFTKVETPTQESYSGIDIGLSGKHQLKNASLAIELCRIWLDKKRNIKHYDQKIPREFIPGLSEVRLPGRNQMLQLEKYQGITWFLDGAHTLESMRACMEWFRETAMTKDDDENLLETYQIVAKDADYKPITNFTAEEEEDSNLPLEYDAVELFAHGDDISVEERMLDSTFEEFFDLVSDGGEIDESADEGEDFYNINPEKDDKSILSHHKSYQSNEEKEEHEFNLSSSSCIETMGDYIDEGSELDDGLPTSDLNDFDNLKRRSTFKQKVASLLRNIEYSVKPDEVEGFLDVSDESSDDDDEANFTHEVTDYFEEPEEMNDNEEILFDSIENKLDDESTINTSQSDVDMDHSKNIAIELNN